MISTSSLSYLLQKHPNGWIAHHRVSGWDLYGCPQNCCDIIASFRCIRLSACPFIVDTVNHLSSHPIPSILFFHTTLCTSNFTIRESSLWLSSFPPSLQFHSTQFPPLCPNHLNLCLSLSPNRSAWAVPLTYSFLSQFILVTPRKP